MTAVSTPSSQVVQLPSRQIGPSDNELSAMIVKATADLQKAMDAAVLAGPIVEPSFQKLGTRLASYGVTSDSYVCSVHTYRQLS